MREVGIAQIVLKKVGEAIFNKSELHLGKSVHDVG